ncbi:SDR family NAD(P)-dependent oxidoreductase [Congregibacter brevis]|uniref:SDR family NAD(P)-dependent oxidoreductase n=1 Tax=Congregibacter brevis TaxID=3081201 RepID=A0ABZ0I9B8_9GAMM|nr:SDR family NAD(P)-dependent oxidoreductase [Congregibacter sp. IMCC45268]
MISLKESIRVARPVEECFEYTADFRTTPEWDATAFKARKISDGPVGMGSQFVVRCKLPLGSIELLYTITEFEAPNMVTLQVESWLFSAVDTIYFTEENGETRVDYHADFSYKMPFAALEGALKTGMLRMGKSALRGLKRALDDSNAPPKISSGSARADRLLWPGLAMFSKWGYRRGQKRWSPMSASLKGQTMVVTGASSGLGLATARELAERGAELILVMRNPKRAEAVVSELKVETGNSAIRAELADLSIMAEVDALADRLLKAGQPIDVLVNNAGALFNDWGTTSEGLEQSFALLLLSPWRLTRALHPLLKAAGQSRVVNVVSGGMYSQKLRVDRLEAIPENYAGATAYARCKRGLTVVTEEWAKSWEKDGIVVNAMHPGWADTPGVESALPAFHTLTRLILRTPEEGADTIVWLAAASEASAVSGKLFLDREPRTTHLLSKTREDDPEREKLMAFLEGFELETSIAA